MQYYTTESPRISNVPTVRLARSTCRAVVLAAGVLVLALLGQTVVHAADAAGFDKYFGSLKHTTKATGFFRAEEIDGRWWLITPEGHPFFSTGLNVLSFAGTATAGGVQHYEQAARRIYGTPEAWAEKQAERCRAWGWNTVGAWSDWDRFRRRMPYTVLLSVGCHDWRSGPASDLFSDEYRLWVRQRVLDTAAPLKDDPFLLGYFLDNEMKWGPDHRGGHLFDVFFAKPAKTNASKRALVAFLKTRYGTLDALRADFRTQAGSWEKLAEADELPARGTPSSMETRLAWAVEVAERFFSVTNEELRKVDPNHLNLGARFISQTVPGPVIAVASKYVDVMSINFYDLGGLVEIAVRNFSPDYLPVDDMLAEHYKLGRRPILVSEWGYRAADAGLPNSFPPIYPTLPTQAARADAYQRQFRRMLAKPWFVGQHWFLYADQPAEGRFDGEDNNFGLVSEQDQPYKLLVERSAAMIDEIYRRLDPVDGNR
ncbi:MAG: hypothetical protein NTW96_20570 [Planctomycetia bacterium]|nr:hypothetical protein [Planctomycetia bacterium]